MFKKLIAITTIAASLGMSENAFAQFATTSKAPFISGAASSPPFVSPPEGQLPACGDGFTPLPVVPGMGGPPTLLPWVPAIPANQIDRSSSGIALPVTPAVAMPPGTLGQLLAPVIPAPPSTPGFDQGALTAPIGSFNPALQQPINPTGGIPGTGGYATTIPTLRRGGQTSRQWELRGRNSSLGGLFPGDGSQDEITRLGPTGWGVPFGVPTGNGLRNNSLDLGGGQRMAIGGTRISTGSSVQDYGLSATRNNPIGALDANQSYEFGQGRRRMPRFSNKTTDFGFPYTQCAGCNTTAQKTGQRLLPRAVITNF